MLNFCTLFDSCFLIRGLALYESLQKHSPGANLFVFTLDDLAYNLLQELALPHLEVINLSQLENEELLAVKPSRSRGEYCWTCTSSAILYCLEHYPIDSCTYIDADIYFYQSPQLIMDELGEDQSVLITSHNYSPECDETENCGKYCVQFTYFKNDEIGLKILKKWRSQCIDWCYSRCEDGKFGDQKYLDEWPLLYPNTVHEAQNLGAGVAPWNVAQYRFSKSNNGINGTMIKTNSTFNICFYHFHDIKQKDNSIYIAHTYGISQELYNLVYIPYITHMEAIRNRLSEKWPQLTLYSTPYPVPSSIEKLKLKKKRIKRFFLKISRLFGVTHP